MAYILGLVVLLGMLAGIDCEVIYSPNEYWSFDCRRYSSSCSFGGACSSITGNCSCNAGRTGHDCRLATKLVCSNDDMVIQLYPQHSLSSSFTGKLAVQDPDTGDILSHPMCTSDITASNGIPEWDGLRFQKNLSLLPAGPCYSAKREVITESGMRHCYTIRLMYTQGLITSSDEVYQYCCSEVSEVSDSVQVQNGGGNPQMLNVTRMVQPLIREVRWTTTNTIIAQGEQITVGDPISFVYRINTTVTNNKDFRLDSCYARPGNLPGGFPIIMNRCRTQDALPIVSNVRRETLSTGVEIHVDVVAFRLELSTFVNVTCEYTLCPETCGGVSLCSGTNVFNYGRRRREVNTTVEAEVPVDQEDEKGVVYMVYVTGERMQTCRQAKVNESEKVCDFYGIFIPVVVVLAVLLLFCLVVSVFLCKKFASLHRRTSCAITPGS
ncbi:uncharacterized protein LOC135462822 isoform X2 [Liolophura sinensis]|uniref:uncharacterized protein LOC135462822 isoform X2 n=1 Tax=Liolophura sinensis TaxID=3198878 RepID=UPI0031587D14